MVHSRASRGQRRFLRDSDTPWPLVSEHSSADRFLNATRPPIPIDAGEPVEPVLGKLLFSTSPRFKDSISLFPSLFSSCYLRLQKLI